MSTLWAVNGHHCGESIVPHAARNMTPHHSHHRYAADLVLLLFFANNRNTSTIYYLDTFKINMAWSIFRINLEAWISNTVIQYKSPCPDGALEKTIIAAANHLSFGLGSQTSTIQIKWSSKFKFANHYSFSVPPSIRLTVDENWRERCLEHKQRKPVNCPN